jgi:hypothetical protein
MEQSLKVIGGTDAERLEVVNKIGELLIGKCEGEVVFILAIFLVREYRDRLDKALDALADYAVLLADDWENYS